MEKAAQDPLTLPQVSDAKSVEGRTGGIFETTSNQHEGRPLTRSAPHADSVSEKEGDKDESPNAVAVVIAETSPGKVNATKALKTPAPAAATSEDQILEPQASPIDEADLASSTSASPSLSSSCDTDSVPVEEPPNNASLAPSSPTTSYSTFDDADDPRESTLATTATGQEETEVKIESCSIEDTLLKVQQFLIDKVRSLVRSFSKEEQKCRLTSVSFSTADPRESVELSRAGDPRVYVRSAFILSLHAEPKSHETQSLFICAEIMQS